MNWVDLVIILTVLVFSIEGLNRGFISQVLDIFGLFFALILSLTFYPQAAQLLTQIFNLPKIAASPVGFLFVWVIAEFIFSLAVRGIVAPITKVFKGQTFDKLLGIIPAAINSLLFLSFILLFIVSLPIRPEVKKDVLDSKIGSSLIDAASVLEKPLNSIFGPIAKQSLTFLTVKPEEKGSIPLEFTQSQLSVDFDAERKMFNLVNQERIKVGVKPLVWDEGLARVGRSHSEDMFRRGYFSHYSPEGKDVADRLMEAGINYNVAGENLALAPDVDRAHTGLMNSEGHRRNILDPEFHKIGIGAINGGIYGEMFTQVFTD